MSKIGGIFRKSACSPTQLTRLWKEATSALSAVSNKCEQIKDRRESWIKEQKDLLADLIILHVQVKESMSGYAEACEAGIEEIDGELIAELKDVLKQLDEFKTLFV